MSQGSLTVRAEQADDRRWPMWLVIGLAGLILAVFAGLIPMANWRLDEYHDFGLFRIEGWSFFLKRLLTWSPRPLSETMAGLYFLAEEGSGRQSATGFLVLLWLSLSIGPVLYVRRLPSVSRLLVGIAVSCLFLLGHAVSEVFYWPMGAVAYIPTLAAISALTFEIIDGRCVRGGGRVFGVVCLLCAAGASEVGAIFAMFFAGAMILLHVGRRIGARRDALPWLLPLLLGVAVMVLLALGRGRLDEVVSYHGVSPNPTYLKHPLASLIRTVPTYFRQILVLDGAEMGRTAIIEGAAVKVLVALGLFALMRGEGRAGASGGRWLLGALAFSLQATLFVSIAGSYYKFGVVCCERHDTLRQCLMILTLLCGAALLAQALPRVGRPGGWPVAGAALLGGAMIVLVGQEFGSIEGAYADWTRSVDTRRVNWTAGHAAGDDMIFTMIPLPPIVGGFTPPEHGTYRSDARPPWHWELVMTFFDKRQIELRPIE